MYPMQGRKHLAPGSRTTRTYAGRPSAALGGRSAIIRTGQCLGGGGSINCAVFPPLLPCLVLPLSKNKNDVLTLKRERMDLNHLIRFVKQTCSMPVPVPLTMTTGRRFTRTLGGVQMSLFHCSERLVGCAQEYIGSTISIFFCFWLCN